MLFVASYDPKNCFPIRVPTDDPFWKGSITCMEFTRSLSAPNLDCSFGFKEQVNVIEQEYTRRKFTTNDSLDPFDHITIVADEPNHALAGRIKHIWLRCT